MNKQSPLALAIKSTLGAAALAVASSSALAQIEEIVVTAQHRAENVQDVPIAVTAIGAEELKKADIFDAGTIAQHTPGLSFSEFAPGQAIPSLRGISSTDDGAGLDNSVALFLDGVYIGRGASINFDMFDLERVEILRGPQGTLFGRNAIGGAINVVSARPDEETTFKAGMTVGNEGIVRYQALVGGALSDNLFGKVSLSHREHDGFVRNVLLGTDLQDEDQTSLRGQLRLDLGASEWLLSADYMEDDRADMGRTPVHDNAPLSLIAKANGVTGSHQNASPKDGYSSREASGISLQGDIDFDTGVLTTITAFRNAKTDWSMASAGASLGPVAPFDEVMDDIKEDIDTFSQEVRWTSTLDGNFNYSAGIYYFVEETDRPETFRVTKEGQYETDGANRFRAIDVGSQAIVGNEYFRGQNETTSFAAYTQGTYEFSEQWHLTLGGRFTVDDKDYTATSINCAQVKAGTVEDQFKDSPICMGEGGSLRVLADTFTVDASESWSDFSPKVSLQFFPNDSIMFFATASKGYKSGGFAGSQGVREAASKPVDPEEAFNYELGFKGDFLDNSLRLNATVYYTDYQDLQVVRFGPVAGTEFGSFQTTNIGEAEIQGAEVEFTWYPTDNLYFQGFYAYLDTEVSDLVLDTTKGVVDASGKTLRSAPKDSSNFSINYNMPTDAGAFDFRLEYSYTARQRGDYIDDRISYDPIELFDGRIAWTSADESWDVSLWGKNLKDESYIAHEYVIGPGGIGTWGAPRTFGLSVNYAM